MGALLGEPERFVLRKRSDGTSYGLLPEAGLAAKGACEASLLASELRYIEMAWCSGLPTC